MYCTKCGAQIPADARFCTKCGIAVQSFVNQNIEEVNPIAQDDVQIDMKQETEPQAEENVHLQVEENVQPQVESITCVNIQPEAWQVERLPIESEKTKKKLISPIMIIIVGTLLIIVTALFLHILGDGESKLKNISPIGAESTDEESDEKEDEQKPVEAELNSEPKTVDMLLSEGKDYLLDGDYKNAMLSYNEAKALDNGNTDIFLFGADVYLAQDNFIEALAILEEGIERSGSEKLDFRKAYVLNNIAIKECISENHYWDRVYEYDKYGNLLRDIYQEYTYDGNGNLIEETCYDENNNFIEKHGFKYNSAGKIIQMMNYTEDGSPLGWTQYEYSENGKIVNEVYYNENSEISFWYGYAYSKDGILEK